MKIFSPQKILLSIAYLPSVSWFINLNDNKIYIEAHEHFIKQTYRNRCKILTANGTLDLIIPVEHSDFNKPITEVKIFNNENWQQKHWRAIESAYKNSPFFDFYSDDFSIFYKREFLYLFDFNFSLTKLCCEILKLKVDFIFTSTYEKNPEGFIDFRNEIHPKKKIFFQVPQYTQVFSDRFSFTPDLSIVDLIFCKGSF